MTLQTTATLQLVLPFEIVPGDDAFLPFDVAVGENAVWVSTARGALARLDLRVRRLNAMIRLRSRQPASSRSGEVASGLQRAFSASTGSIR